MLNKSRASSKIATLPPPSSLISSFNSQLSDFPGGASSCESLKYVLVWASWELRPPVNNGSWMPILVRSAVGTDRRDVRALTRAIPLCPRMFVCQIGCDINCLSGIPLFGLASSPPPRTAWQSVPTSGLGAQLNFQLSVFPEIRFNLGVVGTPPSMLRHRSVGHSEAARHLPPSTPEREGRTPAPHQVEDK